MYILKLLLFLHHNILFIKYMINKLFALIVFIILIPIFAIIAIIILIDDGYPIFFVQKRVGQHNKPFHIYKFRTMIKSSPSIPTNSFHNINEYKLKSGTFLRKWSFDELPNLINILKGEMNFIGPRPLIPTETDLLQKRINKGIHTLKPGITGWAQVHGRDELSIDERIELDTFYLKNNSILTNFKIIKKTIVVIINRNGVS